MVFGKKMAANQKKYQKCSKFAANYPKYQNGLKRQRII
jgi:hypothetical protein